MIKFLLFFVALYTLLVYYIDKKKERITNMLQTTLNEIKLAESLREYDRGIERAEMLRTVKDLYWAWRLQFEDDLETDAEIEEFYLNLDELDQIVSDIECGMATLDEMISFLRGNGCSFILSKEVINQYA